MGTYPFIDLSSCHWELIVLRKCIFHTKGIKTSTKTETPNWLPSISIFSIFHEKVTQSCYKFQDLVCFNQAILVNWGNGSHRNMDTQSSDNQWTNQIYGQYCHVLITVLTAIERS